jgi:GTPase Era involved in 16S rRNA processing
MADPIEIAVVGHTNAGKTSLLRTLARRSDFGEVSDRPGTTRHVESVDLRVEGRPAVRYLDTPGLEDPTGLLAALGPLRADMTPPQRIRAFLQGADARDRFEQEAKVLRALLGVDAALFVIDCREPVVAKFRCEVEILAACGKPVLPVLNFVRDEASREAAWQALLSDFALHALVRFDAVAPYAGAEQRLYRDLRTLLPSRDAELGEVAAYLDAERLARREASRRVIAETLVDVTAARVMLDRDELADAGRKAEAVAALRADALRCAQRGVHELLGVHAFSADEADLRLLPWLDGRWESDLFDAGTLLDAGRKLGTGAAVGASIGLAADAALAGLSLGTGAAIGAVIGGAASQGFGPMGRRLRNYALGREEVSVEDAVVLAIARRLLALVVLLETRGHAASARIDLDAAGAAASEGALEPLLKALRPARSHPEWVLSASRPRAGTVEAVAGALRAVVGAARDSMSSGP